MNSSPFSFQIVGYPPANVGAAEVPSVNDSGAAHTLTPPSYTIPPVIWMIIFLTVGYLGLRLLLE